MSFGNPKMLWLLAVTAPALALFLWWTWSRRQALIREFTGHRLVAQLTTGVLPGMQKLRRVLLFTAVCALMLGLARPQWGFTWEEATQRGRDIVVAIDTSRSMLAEDITPNRLQRAKLAALDLLQLGPYDRFGLVAFAGSAFLQCPLTFDDEAFRQSVQILEPGIIPQGGTAVGEAIETARKAFEADDSDNHKVVILFTDGEDHETGAVDAAQAAAAEGIRIFTVGVGTPAGELLRVTDQNGNVGYLKDAMGNVVKSRLNEKLLQEVASTANGFYVPLRGADAMAVLYKQGLAPLPTTERSTKLMKRVKEQYHWPVSLGIFLLLLEVFVPERRRASARASEIAPATAGVPALAALLLYALCGIAVDASPRKALREYQSGDYRSALSEYQRLVEKNPADPRLRYNAGAAAYQAGSFDQAARQFQAALGTEDSALRQSAFYNLANSEFRAGESIQSPQEKMALWEQSIQHYDQALQINPADRDAQFNRDLVRKKLEELKKQQQQQQQQQNNSDQKQEEQKQENSQEPQNQQQQEKEQQQNNSTEQQPSQDQKKSSEPQDQENRQQQPDSQQPGEQQEQKPSQQAQQPKGGNGEETKESAEENQEVQMAEAGRMTPAQAKQLLDAQKSEERALLFIPQDRKSNPNTGSFKDW